MTGEERVTVMAILDLLRELRDTDEHWRDRMEAKTDKIVERLDATPQMWRSEIASCRAERSRATAAAEAHAAEVGLRHRLRERAGSNTARAVAIAAGITGLVFGLLEAFFK